MMNAHVSPKHAAMIRTLLLAMAVITALLLPHRAYAQSAPTSVPSTAPSQPVTTPASLPAPLPAIQPADVLLPAPMPVTATTMPASMATTASAPTSTSAPATRPVTDAPFALNFKDASLRSVLEYLSEVAGLVIVEDARAEGRVTVMSRQCITADEAIALLDTVLREKGFAAIRNGRTLKVVTLDQAKKELIPVRSGNDPAKIQPGDRVVTQIIPIRYADAVKLKADLASLIPASADVSSNASSNTLIVTDTESTVRKIVEIISAIDVHMSEVSQVKVFQLKFANATNAAKLITDIFKEDTTSQNQNQNQGGGRRFSLPGFLGFGGPQQQQNADTRQALKVTASADERTNTLVVSAPPDVMKVIEGLVKELDADPSEQQAVFVYHLKNAVATDLEGVLNNIFGTGTGSSTSNSQQNRNLSYGSISGNSSSGSSSSSGSRGLSTGTNSSRSSSNRNTRSTGSTGSRYGSSGYGNNNNNGTTSSSSDLIGQVYVVANDDTNSLLVTTSTKNFDRVRALIADLDRPVPQVLIKALIAEVTHTNTLDLGVEFSAMNLRASGKGFSAGPNFGVAAQTEGFLFKLNEDNATAAVQALATVARLDVLSRPYILTGDNQEASIMVGQSVPFVTNSQTYDTGAVSNTVEYEDIGIILDVTPHINPDGLVTLDVYPEISSLTGETVQISESLKASVIAKRFAESRVAIRNGQTIVIGGLMQDKLTKSVSKVPLLGDIPGLGLLFQASSNEKTKTELLIFLTPHVAAAPDELKAMSADEKAGAKIVHDAVEPGMFEQHMQGMQRGANSRPASTSQPTVFTTPTLPTTGGK